MTKKDGGQAGIWNTESEGDGYKKEEEIQENKQTKPISVTGRMNEKRN